ncbi:MAG: GNAT family N-acetyltransferase [Anaerolineales bacterium]|nr:GNAT family N-acetyltransferase [Anaerolineales bacterium]
MSFTVSEMTNQDYEGVLALWKTSEAIILKKNDSKECIAKLLARNPGMSFVARDGVEYIGAVLCSHDGRTGYLSHLVVRKDHRREGVGRQLVGRCLYTLTGMGIHTCILLIMKETPQALNFWRKVDPAGRVNLVMMGPRESL